MKKNHLNNEFQLLRKLNCILYKKYGDSNKNHNYQKITCLIKAKSSHIYITFQECTTYDDIEEYQKRFYYKWESKNKLKEFFEYYINYLLFFCRPIFANNYCNTLLHYCNDVKADIFYKNRHC